MDLTKKINEETTKTAGHHVDSPEQKPLPWEALGRVDVIKKWSDEIKAAFTSNAGLAEWSLVGTAVTIVHDDVDDCRNILKRVAHDVSFDFIWFEDLEVIQYFSEEEVNSPCEKPTIVYLEPGDWMKSADDETANKSGLAPIAQANICEMIKQFNPKHPIIYATSVSDFDTFSVSFRKVGLFDRRFNIVKPTLEELGEKFLSMVGNDICGKSFTEHLGKVGKLIDLDFDDKRRQALIALTLKRIAKSEKRKVELADLVNLSMKGSAEFDAFPIKPDHVVEQVAIHEAGHAAIAIIDSSGENTPEYATIIESHGYNGIVADSLTYHYKKNNRNTYADMRHQIRVTLAGRVAEHFVLGSEHVTVASARGDLKKASELCFYMFSTRGISDDMETFDGASANLTVELEPHSPSNLFRIETMARNYLAKQYKIVYEMLNSNQSLFNEIKNALLEKRILDQKDLLKITNDTLLNTELLRIKEAA